MTHDEIQQLRCVLRAGQEPEPGTLDRVLLTIADLERELLQSTSRVADETDRLRGIAARHARLDYAVRQWDLCPTCPDTCAALHAFAREGADLRRVAQATEPGR